MEKKQGVAGWKWNGKGGWGVKKGLRVAMGWQAESGEDQGWNWEICWYRGRDLNERKRTMNKGPKGGT